LNYLPSKNLVIVAGIIFGALVVSWFLSSDGLPSTANTPNRNITAHLEEIGEVDSDGDGLPDWEEQLRGLNPNKSDTDGDGILDADEKAPDKRSLSKTAPIFTTKGSLTNEVLNSLGTFFDSLVASDGTISRDDLTLSDSTRSALAKDLTGNLKTKKIANLYSAEDITTDDSQDSKSYFNSVGIVVGKYFSDKEIAIQNQILNDFAVYLSDQSKYAKSAAQVGESLESLRLKFVSGELDVKKISVPVGKEQIHADFLNMFSNAAQSIDQMTSITKDPVLGYIGMISYRENANASVEIIRSLKIIFEEDNLTFDNADGGYILQQFSQNI
jgi:hypothetical protein